MNRKRVVAFSLLAILSLSLIIQFVDFASAQEVVPQFFKDIWNQWKAGAGVSENYARFMFLVIIGLLVYSVADKIPGLAGSDRSWMRWIISAAIAFLSTAYFTQADLYALLISYSALGMALGLILPFLILAFFSYDILSNTQNIRNAWVRNSLVVGLWLIFGVYTIIRLVNLGGAPDTTKYLHWIVIGLIVAFLIFHRWIMYRIIRGQMEGAQENVARTMEGSRIWTEEQNAQFEAMGAGDRTRRRHRT